MKAMRVEIVKHNVEGPIEIFHGEPCPLACVADDCNRSCPGPGVKLLIGEKLTTRRELVAIICRQRVNMTPIEIVNLADALRTHLGLE